MGQLEDMAMFTRIVDAGGISKAADQLNIAKSAVSRRLSDLERRLGTQLLVRSTRTSKLTEAGTLYYKRTQSILDEVSELNEQASGNKAKVEGILKMSAPLSFGLIHLSPLIDEYAKEHENLGFQVDFTDRHVDLIEEGFELALRIGSLPDSSFQAKRITPIRHAFCASPDYLKKVGTPNTPSELQNHAFLQYGLLNDAKIQVKDKGGNPHAITIQSNISANNGDFLKLMALQGHGITYLPTFLIYQELANGKLVSVLSDYQLPTTNAYAVYPRNRFLPERCRRFIDFLADQFGESPYWDSYISHQTQYSR